MSAYDDLFNELGEARRLGHMSSGWAQLVRDLDAFKAEIAHELAEKIREAPEPEGLHDRPIAYANGWCDGGDQAADLIDPEVSDD